MRKIVKTLTAAILAFVIAFGSLTAFASEEKPVLSWSDVEYTYAGTLAEGKNTVELPTAESFYYIFNAEKAGYYTVDYNWREISYFKSPESIENGVADGYKHNEYLEIDEDYDSDTYLFFFEAGENILASWIGYEATAGDPSNVEIAYYGETVSDIKFEGGTKYFLVPEYNIYEMYDEDNEYPDNAYYLEGGKTEIIFDSGKTIEVSYSSLICTAKEEINVDSGDFAVTVYFGESSFEKTVSVYPVSKEITKIEIAGIEDYLDVAEAYDGQILYDFYGMELTLTYADGHTVTETLEGDSMGIDLLNGNPYYFPLDFYYSYEDEGVNFYVTLAGVDYVKAPCTLRAATDRENRQHLNYEIALILEDAVWDIRYNFESLSWAGNLWEGIIYLRRALFDTADEIFTAFENIFEEIADCMRG